MEFENQQEGEGAPGVEELFAAADGEGLDAAEFNRLQESEAGREWLADYELVRRVGRDKDQLRGRIESRARRRADYVIDRIRNGPAENEPFSRGIKQRFLDWLDNLILRFYFKAHAPERERRSDVVFEVEPRRPWFRLRFSHFVVLTVGVFLAAVLLKEPARDRAPSSAADKADMQQVFTTPERPRLFQLDSNVRVASQTGAAFKQESARQISLKSGEVWLDVQPGGKGFEVATPQGVVRVLGTSFGVSLKNGRVHVDVAAGKVKFQQGAGVVEVAAGRRLTVDADGPGEPAPRATGAQRPEWVHYLERGIIGAPRLENCQLHSHAMGFSMRTLGLGQMMYELSEPIAERATFRIRYQNLKPKMSGSGSLMNGYFAFGQDWALADTIKCGTAIQMRKHSIHKGPFDERESTRGAALNNPRLRHQVFTATVTVDLTQRKVWLTADGETIEETLPDELREVRYIGYFVNGSFTAFSGIERLD